MNVNRKKLQLAMARACMSSDDLTKSSGLPRPTVNNAISGRSVTPKTLGRIAQALNCDPADIMEGE